MDDLAELQEYWAPITALKAELDVRIGAIFGRRGKTAFSERLGTSRIWIHQVLACHRVGRAAARRWVEILVPDRAERDQFVAALVRSEEFFKRPALLQSHGGVISADRVDALYVASVRFHESALAADPAEVAIERRRAVATLTEVTTAIHPDAGKTLQAISADAHARLSDLHNWDDELQLASSDVELGLGAARRTGDARIIAEAHRSRGTVRNNQGFGPLAVGDFKIALSAYRSDSDPGMRLITVRGLMNALTTSGLPDDALAVGSEYLAEVERQPNAALSLVYYEGIGRAHLRAGRVIEARAALAAAAPLLANVSTVLHRLIYLSTCCETLLDKPDECEDVARKALAQSDPTSHLRQRKRIEAARERAKSKKRGRQQAT